MSKPSPIRSLLLHCALTLGAGVSVNHSLGAIIFSENVGTTGGAVAVGTYTGWQNFGTLTFSGTGITDNATPPALSSGYTGASGGKYVSLGSVAGPAGNNTLTISGIDTLNYSGFGFSFGGLKSAQASDYTDLTIGFTSANGNGAITFLPQPTGGGTQNVWSLITASSVPLVGSANLSITFANTSGTKRLDDISLTGTLRTSPLTLTWNGASGNGFWHDGNWSGNNAPLTGDSLTFAGSVQTSTTNNSTGLTIVDYTFASSASSFTNSGNSITLSGAITNLSANGQTISHPIILAAGARQIDTSAGSLTLGADLSGGGGLAKTGSGTLNLNGSNSYTGETKIGTGTANTGGTVSLGSNNALPVNGAVNLAGGTLFLNGRQIGNTVTSTSLGTLTLSANSSLSLLPSTASQFIAFSNYDRTAGTLTITGWTNNGTSLTTGTNGKVLFATTAAFDTTELQNIVFDGFNPGATLISFDSNFLELVPVPEPTTWFGGFALIGLVAFREHRRLGSLLFGSRFLK